MRFTGSLPGARIDLNGYKKALDLCLREAVAQAAVAWLGAVSEKIPVWSGASRATLMPLASTIGFSLSVSPVTTSRVDLGLSNATGELNVDADAGTYFFTYSTSLSHLIFNEYNNANAILSPSGHPYFHLKQPGPYQFQEAGQTAFSREAAGLYAPSPLEYLVNDPVRV